MVALPFEFDTASVARLNDYGDFPDIPALSRLKERRQWVCWKYVTRDGRLTKPPYQPANGMPASHSDPRHWGTYQEAVSRARRSRMDGVGYVLTDDDDITGIDLDNVRDPETGDLEPWAGEMVALGETYCEVSPSETGLRLIVDGKIEKTIKSDAAGVEIYRDKRYLTITGWHVPGTPQAIQAAQKTIAALLARVEGCKPAAAPEATIPKPERLDHRFPEQNDPFRAINDAALQSLALWVPVIFGAAARFQPGTGAYRVSSKALGRKLQEDLSIAPNGIKDWGVHDMGDPRQGSRTPIDLVIEFGHESTPREAAFWLCHKMGRDPAIFGFGSDDHNGADLADQLLKTRRVIEAPDGTLADAETGEVIEPQAEPIIDEAMPSHLAAVPGLVGMIADWIDQTARFPQPVLSLAAAITIVGTAAGRHIRGPTESSTHLYMVCLAPSGYGKNHPLNQIKRIMAAAGMRHHIGPDQFMSMPAAINFMIRTPLSLCPMDEFGSFLKRMNGKRASGFETAISGTLRQAWDPFKTIMTPEWAGRASEMIVAPAMSIYGASTPDEFYGALEGADVTNGVLNRFLAFATDNKPEERDPPLDARIVPDALINGLRAIYFASGELVAAQLNRSEEAPATLDVGETSEAFEIRRSFIAEVRAMGEANAKHKPFLVRTSESAIRLATIRAIGRDPIAMKVNGDDMHWGCEMAMWCARTMIRGAGLYIADSETQEVANAIRRAIVGAGGRIKRRDLIRKIDHRYRTRDIDEGIKALSESEEIHVEKTVPEKGGTPSYWYSITR